MGASASISTSASASASAPTSTSASASASASAPTSTSASASAPTSTSAPVYDVFLNHRGPDVKNTLASHMYRRLLSYGLHVFLDQQELQPGEALTPQIEGAIASSSVQVAIFSTRYAESNWCLDELVRMLLESKRSGATIIPVFINVQPSDLRWTDKGRYAQALLTHEKKGRYNKETLADWRAALAEVSHISGFELKSCNGDEGELVDKVVQQVMKKVKKPPLDVAVHPTGLDNKLNDFERKVLFQQQHSGQAKVVGIVGLGGVGKTTMAKEFFNRKRSSYDRSSFLPEVRESAARSSLTSLQSKLYKDLTGSAEVMHSVDEYTGMLRSLLSSSQVLVILDDIDHVEQLLAFFSPRDDVLHPGSLIIVTSRNLEVLTVLGIEVSSIYNMTGLDEEHSQLLFCLHAFDQRFPVSEFEELVGKFLKLCAGLPLSLKVFGRLLHGKKDLEHWEGQLKKIFKSGLPTDIQSRLRISYDSLDEEEKNIFLDIACFFIGTKKDKAIRIWDGSGWAGSVGFLNLVSKCLVEIDSQNCIRMHDQLRDLGRDLAEKEPLGSGLRLLWEKEPLGSGLRLWRPTDSLFRNVPPQSTVRGIKIDLGSRIGRGIKIDLESRIGEECSNHIVDMRGLQLLSAPLAYLESISEVLRKADLVWLRLSIRVTYSIPGLPSWIPIRNLRVLEVGCDSCDSYSFEDQRFRRYMPGLRRVLLPEAALKTLWETEIAVPLELKELRVHSQLLGLPRSIGQLKHLEIIELHNFRGSSLPEEFFDLYSLKHLKLRLTASEMKSLPDSLGKLTNLQHLDLSVCFYLQTLPASFGKLTNLQHLDLSGCFYLQTLPASFGNLTKLQHVNLGWCGRLKALPSAIGDLCNLKILKLHCHLLEILPDSIGELKQLISLSIVDYNYINRRLRKKAPIPEVSFASVEKAHKCMVRLKRLELENTRITEISFGEGVCPNLQELILNSCVELEEIGALPTTLTSLEMRYCHALNRIRGISGLRKLQELGLPLKMLIKLQWVGISKCDKMTMIESLKAAVTPESYIFKMLDLKESKVERRKISSGRYFQDVGFKGE